MNNTNYWLKEVGLDDGKEYCDLLIELSDYDDVYARPVPKGFTYEDFDYFKAGRVQLAKGEDLPSNVIKTSTYWVMDNDIPVGYATLKHRIDEGKPGGHFGLCLKKDVQNKGIGMFVSSELSRIAYEELGIDKVVFTSKDENIQSQRSVEKIGAQLVSIHDGYHFYELDLVKKMNEIKGRKI